MQPPGFRGVSYITSQVAGQGMEDEASPGTEEEGVPLMEGWMLGALFFPAALAEIVRVPPANDNPAG